MRASRVRVPQQARAAVLGGAAHIIVDVAHLLEGHVALRDACHAGRRDAVDELAQHHPRAQPILERHALRALDVRDELHPSQRLLSRIHRCRRGRRLLTRGQRRDAGPSCLVGRADAVRHRGGAWSGSALRQRRRVSGLLQRAQAKFDVPVAGLRSRRLQRCGRQRQRRGGSSVRSVCGSRTPWLLVHGMVVMVCSVCIFLFQPVWESFYLERKMH